MFRYFARVLFSLLLFAALPVSIPASAQAPDTVYAGCYITSIHNIDFKDKEYTADLWLWLKYRNRKFDFLQNLEIPQAKSVSRSFATIDTSGERVYLLMKLQCIMKDTWKIENFPFDKQKLRFSIENSQFDSRVLIFVADTLGKHFDPRFTLRGWRIDSLNITTGTRIYETTFGDAAVAVPHTEYSNYKVRLQINRDAMGLFWKMFLGMYVAFLIAYMCLYIHTDNIDSRFGLSVGALFAVVGNKYIVDSSLPESTSFTLVDTLHGITLFFIFIVMMCNSYTLRMVKQERPSRARRFDRVSAAVVLVCYLLLNGYFIYNATRN
ncbi:hypothetical protein [Nemorincola caseinilytica]|uniref:hypothetical protein n=1 Tax=Nemorincola caseinilytica TaxID=2054315 RepID=UPI0031EB09A2